MMKNKSIKLTILILLLTLFSCGVKKIKPKIVKYDKEGNEVKQSKTNDKNIKQ